MPLKNLKKRRAYDRRYYAEHKEERLAYRRTRREKDRLIWKAWAKRNPKRRMAHLAKYKRENPDYYRIYNLTRKYVRIALKNFPYQCVGCGIQEKLHTHHIDHNRENNNPVNLEFRCHVCHGEIHSL